VYKVCILKLLPLSGFELLMFSSQSAAVSKLRAGRSGVGIPREGRVFAFSKPSSQNLKPHSLSCPLSTGFPFLGAKRPGREADHSPPYSAEGNNGQSSISTLSIYPRDVCKHFNIFVYRTKSKVTHLFAWIFVFFNEFWQYHINTRILSYGLFCR
jgi:hypothetical protein